jgi:hypothetical protein
VADEKEPVLQRAALERVLLRAAELQAVSADVPEALSEQELISVAGEVGISPAALKQALSEERMRIVLPDERGVLAAVAGPATFVAARLVSGAAPEVLAALDRTFQGEENLTERRRFPDRIVWGPRGGFAGAVRAIARLDGRGFPLVRADEVAASVVASSPGKAHVRIEASLAGRRTRAAQRAVAGVVLGAAGAVAMVAMNVFAPLAFAAGALVAATSAWLTRRNYRRDAGAAQLAIEQALDRLEFGEPKKRTLLDQLLIAGRPGQR